jgi:CheY-like chemotaxis protein
MFKAGLAEKFEPVTDQNMRILIADEEPIVLETLGDFLLDLGHEVFVLDSISELIRGAQPVDLRCAVASAADAARAPDGAGSHISEFHNALRAACNRPASVLRISSPGDMDLILVDTGAPREMEEQIVRQIHYRFPGADIILMSGGKATISHQCAIASRVFGYLHKPVRLAELELDLARIKESRINR